MNILIVADSGSTKADWFVYVRETGQAASFSTSGINAVTTPDAEIKKVLREVKDYLGSVIADAGKVESIRLFFYGAGCGSPWHIQKIRILSAEIFGDNIHAEAYSDLVGAARAIFGDSEGLACILGTGSNSGLYNGREITAHVPSLGFILGDEGSGSALGKRLLNRYFKGPFPENVKNIMRLEFDLEEAAVVEKIYRKERPNAYLASFVPFIKKHTATEPTLQKIVMEEFRQFFDRNIKRYPHHETLQLGFVGSVAHFFRDQLQVVAEENNMKIFKILRHPIEELAKYHVEKL